VVEQGNGLSGNRGDRDGVNMSTMTVDAMEILLHSNTLITQFKTFNQEQKMGNIGKAIEKISMALVNNGGDGMATIYSSNYAPEEKVEIEKMAAKNKVTINWQKGVSK